MRNDHVNQKLSEYVAGDLPADESRIIAEHLMACARCRREYEEISNGARFASMLSQVTAPPDLWDGISRQLDAQSAPGKRGQPEPAAWFSFSLPRLLAAGAAAACLILALSWYFLRQTDSNVKIAALPTPQPTTPPPLPAVGPISVDPHSARAPSTDNRKPVIAGRENAASMEVVSLAGLPRIETRQIDDRGRINVGEWLETGSDARARIRIAEIGRVEVEPNSRIGLLATRRTEHRLKLARGRMQASIYAPPRLFIVETPAATAIDLGCEYTLDVDESGAAHLHVTSGYVALVDGKREVIVPAGAVCRTLPGVGTGTPYFEDATAAFRFAVTRFDETKNLQQILPVLLAESRRRDTLTLWHVLQIAPEAEREAICDRMFELYGPPEGVTRAGLIALDRAMLDMYRKRLEWVW
ncbi:MAG: FecR domain-containing protein [Acidobacteria bacterium]|nr:FecR domain-containing protein [Acidobacteriota bacterium]